MAEQKDMWQCQTVNCGYIYNPDKGDRKGKIPPGTRFEDLPEDWKCLSVGLANTFSSVLVSIFLWSGHILSLKKTL